MARSLLVGAVVVFSLVGCVGIAPGTPAPPTTQVSLGATTPAPTAAQTAAPTATPAPVATPTAAPPTVPPVTAEPSTEATAPATGGPPSAEPSAGVIEDFGADTLLFSDDFSDDTSGWGVGTTAGGTVAYVDGALQFDTAANAAWMWSRRTANSASSVMHVEGDFMPSAFGYQGLLCGDSDAELWGAVSNAAGIYLFAKLTSGGVSLLTGNQVTGFEIAPGETTRIALDCAGTDTGQFRMQVSIPDVGVAAIYEGAEGEGAASFDRAGIYSEASADPYSLKVDNVSVYGGTGDATMSVAAQALLLHVPAAWRDACFESPSSVFTTGALATVSCPLTDGRSDIVEYTLFESAEDMDAEYQNRVDTWATDTTVQHCDTGPDEEAYTAGGVDAGRVMCAPQTAGTRMDWTYDPLLILSTLTDFEGSYADMHEDWQIAGPE